MTIEMQVEFTGSARSLYLQEQFRRVMPKLRDQVEAGSAKGGIVMKPYIDRDQSHGRFCTGDMFYPVSFDGDGDITAAVFADQRQRGDKFYTRLEYHSMTAEGCLIRNLAFRSSTKDTLGQEVTLADIEDWKGLLPEATITGIDRPLFAYFKFPAANTIDPTSPLGVSCYARAVELIEQADKQWSRFLWENEAGEMALYVDALALKKDPVTGLPILPNKRLYRTIETGGEGSDMFKDWAPDLRNDPLLKGLDAILKRIEFVCGLAYGTISDPNAVEKTATEIASSKQRSYATIVDTQKALQGALEQLLWAMDTWATIGRLAPRGAYQTAFTFDDSVVVDTDARFQQDMRLVTAGLMSKVEFRVRNFKESEAVAKEKIAEAQGEMQAQADLFALIKCWCII